MGNNCATEIKIHSSNFFLSGSSVPVPAEPGRELTCNCLNHGLHGLNDFTDAKKWIISLLTNIDQCNP